MRRALLLTLLLASSSCKGRPPDDAAPARVERPRIELAGCRHVVGEACHLPAGASVRARIWVDLRPGAPLWITVYGVPVTVEPTAIDGGQRLEIPLGPAAKRLVIDGVDPAWTRPFDDGVDPAWTRPLDDHLRSRLADDP